jgi:hypothetical protein
MALVRKAQSISNVARKKEVKKLIVGSARQPSSIKDMGDTAFGQLDATKDNLLVSYDSGSNKFVLVTADELLSVAVEDNELPDDFVTQLEQELDLGEITVIGFDGGTF